MIHTDINGFSYYHSLDDAKADGYTPVHAFSVLCFFVLKGRTTNLAKENLIPFNGKYCVLGTDKRYYVRDYRGFSVDALFFCRPELGFTEMDVSAEVLQRYIYDDRAWLLYTQDMITDMKKMLDRVCKAHVNGNASLSYKLFIQILESELKLEDYKDYGRNLTGFKTACKIQEDYINELFKKTLKN